MSGLLLRGGTVLIHNDLGDQVQAIMTDILVKGNTIKEIATGMHPMEGCDTIDCTGKIVSPGFVDTHNHHWESALKGLCENLTAVSYFATMFTASSALTSQDVFWSTLAGCLQSIDAGTTTTLDYAHMSWSEDHGPQALAGTATSGIRSVFAYSPSVRLKSTTPEVVFDELLPEWFIPSLERLPRLSPFSHQDPLIRLGLGFDFYFLGKKAVQDVFQTARSLGVQLITSHWASWATNDESGLPATMQEYGLEQDRVVISHFGGASAADCEIINSTEKWFISSSPSVEITMGLGPPVCFQDEPPLLDASCSLGVDCHCGSSASMISEMRVALLEARGADAKANHSRGKIPRRVCRTAQDAYLMATIRGARALGMDDEIGSIAVGKKADFIIFDSHSPAMAPAANIDPVTAIVMHADTRDIETVIIDGCIKKRDGKLVPTSVREWDGTSGQIAKRDENVSWSDILPYLTDIQQRFAENLGRFDLEKIKASVSSLYGMLEA